MEEELERPSKARLRLLSPRSAGEREERVEEDPEAVVVAVVLVLLVVEVAVELRVGREGGSSPLEEGFGAFLVSLLLVLVDEEDEEEEEEEEAETVRRRLEWWRTAPFPLRYRTIFDLRVVDILKQKRSLCVVDLTRHTARRGRKDRVTRLDVPTQGKPSLLLTEMNPEHTHNTHFHLFCCGGC